MVWRLARPARYAGRKVSLRSTYFERHRSGRHAAPLRCLYQLEEHGELCLDRGADRVDQRRLPPRRRVLCGGGNEGRVRPARRRLEGREIRALAAGASATADVPTSQRDLRKRDPDWLHAANKVAAVAIEQDFEAWKVHRN